MKKQNKNKVDLIEEIKRHGVVTIPLIMRKLKMNYEGALRFYKLVLEK